MNVVGSTSPVINEQEPTYDGDESDLTRNDHRNSNANHDNLVTLYPGEPPAGELPAGEPPVGEPPAGEPPAGEPPAGEPPAKKIAVDGDEQSTEIPSMLSKSANKLKIMQKSSPYKFESDNFPPFSSEKYAVPSVYYLLRLIKQKHYINLLAGSLYVKPCYERLATAMKKAGFTNFSQPGACHEIYRRAHCVFATARKRYTIRLSQRGNLDYRKVVKPRNPIYYKMVGWVTPYLNSKMLTDLIIEHDLSAILKDLDAIQAEEITEADHKVKNGVYSGPQEPALDSTTNRGQADDLSHSTETNSKSLLTSESETTPPTTSTVEVQQKSSIGTASQTLPGATGSAIYRSQFRLGGTQFSDPTVEVIKIQMRALNRQQKRKYTVGIQKIFTDILTRTSNPVSGSTFTSDGQNATPKQAKHADTSSIPSTSSKL